MKHKLMLIYLLLFSLKLNSQQILNLRPAFFLRPIDNYYDSNKLNYHNSLRDFQLDSINKIKINRSNSFFLVATISKKNINEQFFVIIRNKDTAKIFFHGMDYFGKHFEYNKQKKIGLILNHIWVDNELRNAILNINKDVILNNKIHFYEFIYFPYKINSEYRKRIQTYLSIKYGISLADGINYYDSGGEVIWNSKKMSNFNYDVFGIGIDHKMNLDQKRSVSYSDDFLELSFADSQHVMDKTFFIVGNNGLNKSFDFNNKKGIYVLKRKWRFIQKNDLEFDLRYNFKINIKENNSTDKYWLMVGADPDFESKVRFIEPTETLNNYVLFSNLKFKHYEKYFTVVKMNKKSLMDSFVVYPNPVPKNNTVTIQGYNVGNTLIELVLYDLKGDVVSKGVVESTGPFEYKFKLPKTGIYLLHIIKENTTAVKKIIAE